MLKIFLYANSRIFLINLTDLKIIYYNGNLSYFGQFHKYTNGYVMYVEYKYKNAIENRRNWTNISSVIQYNEEVNLLS